MEIIHGHRKSSYSATAGPKSRVGPEMNKLGRLWKKCIQAALLRYLRDL